MLFDKIQNRYKKLLIVIIPLFVFFMVFAFLAYYSASSLLGQNSINSKDNYDIEEYDYHLRSNATDLQKELFKELSELIKDGADDIAIAESVVKNYIADTYTWDNKNGQWDVGGICYVHSPLKIAIYTETKDKFYCYLDKYQEEYGTDGLLEVTGVTVSSSNEPNELHEYDGKQYKCFDVTCDWEYSNDSRLAGDMSNHQYFRVIKNDDNRFEIVNAYGDTY